MMKAGLREKRLRQKKIMYQNQMRVSFDLDEVLFVNPQKYDTEPALKFPLCLRYKERLRAGTVDLIHRLQAEDISVWVYTSSFRSVRYIQKLFAGYGVYFDEIVNGSRHMAEVQRDKSYSVPNKLPSAYHIALHIDDENHIVENGKLLGFNVLRVYEPDDHWADKVMDRALKIKQREYSE